MIPDELIEKLTQTMPRHEGPDLLEDRDVPKYDYITFLKNMMGNGDEESQEEEQAGSINGAH